MKIGNFIKLFLILAFLVNKASAEVLINVNTEDYNRTKILFFGFNNANANINEDSKEILNQVIKNLKTTDLFEILVDDGLVAKKQEKKAEDEFSASKSEQALKNDAQTKISSEDIPDFEKYSQSGIGAIAIAEFNFDSDNNLEMKIRLWDLLDQKQLFGKLYSASKPNYKKVANMLSDEIFKSITGEKQGHFNSQILYVAEYGSPSNRIKKITMMDFNGENRKILTSGRDLVLTPIFSKSPNQIYYLRYFENRPQVFSLDLKNFRTQKLGNFKATTFAASVHPKDFNLVLISAIFDGNSDIYEMNIEENQARRLTKNPAIDTTASYSPDGGSIVFSSDRDGSQQIYTMNNQGTNIKKITNGKGSYAKPVFSPDGSMIAFTRIKGGKFYIGTISKDGLNERLLTTGYLAENAKWSPNGRYLIYSKKRSQYGIESVPRLFTIDVSTGFEHELPTPSNEGATDPDWIAI